ncbi:hypothetical protein ACQLRR_004236 [Escherichia coli]|uniref:hypothetical protein n=1 Tax=Escherichia coli TaxID=562 RepID=UPI00182857C2|nr:hypothetical protein [Escherichia coli]EFG9986384.1 hypothetical protein [Escherichia coli]MCN5253958.1 hypothetical protein [Escherichia coli]MCN9011226.1 hypothetical protein [Escherichia coli]
MKLALSVLLITTSFYSFSGTIDDYLDRKPEVKSNSVTNTYVSHYAFMIAMMEAQQRHGRSDNDFISGLLSNNGDVYAKLAVKKLANDCVTQRSIGQSGELNNNECNIVIRANKSD